MLELVRTLAKLKRAPKVVAWPTWQGPMKMTQPVVDRKDFKSVLRGENQLSYDDLPNATKMLNNP